VGIENDRWRREFVGWSGDFLPQKIFKSRGWEMEFLAFSIRDWEGKTGK